MSWVADLRSLLGQQQACVVVTLNLISGSAPREAGSRMIVTSQEALGSIGGGNLEYQATERARDMLENRQSGFQEQVLYGLGPALNQCCGGAVAVLYEVFSESSPPWLEQLQVSLSSGQPSVLLSCVDAASSFKGVVSADTDSYPVLPQELVDVALNLLAQPDKTPMEPVQETTAAGKTWWLEFIRQQRRPVMLFGAGHVGQAVARALAPLPFLLSWVDSRAGVFPHSLPENLAVLSAEEPQLLVAQAPPDCIFIVMTHSHQLDEDICFEVFRRGDYSWLGLIGSATKRRRFVHRLEQRGIAASELEALICPIGLSSIRGKQPATIALSLAAQLMTEYED